MRVSQKEIFKKKLLGKASAKETFRESFIKAQSAMEYLMTYGWAILIISVVLAALFQLGVFNPMTFAPKAPPGSCQVFRPNGPGTTSFINLEGICSGELPQYVAQFNGQSSYINIPYSPEIDSGNAYTVVAWVDTNGTLEQIFSAWAGGTSGYQLFIDNGDAALWSGAGTVSSSTLVNNNEWHQVVGIFQATGSGYIYVDGRLVAGPLTVNNIVSNGNNQIGVQLPNSNLPQYFRGDIANVQLYNTSLSANDIQALYLEGIGGAPIDLQHLVAWWPLNGNANDYSGNGNNGQINGDVNFVSNWYNSYTPP